MLNYIQPGKRLTVTAPSGGLTSGQGVLLGAVFGVAYETAAAGALVDIALDGCYTLPSDGSAFTFGELVYWNGSAVTPTASGNTKIGVSLDSLASGGSTVDVRLNGAF